MTRIRFLSFSEQMANHLREEIFQGRWTDVLPGLHALSGELRVDFKTVTAALGILEKEGLLVSQGRGRSRRIALDGVKLPTGTTFGILCHGPRALTEGWILELLHGLRAAGHGAFVAGKSQLELNMDVERVARHVDRYDTNAWIVVSGSFEVMEWFVNRGKPALALFGRGLDLPIARVGPDKTGALSQATKKLVEMGHRRIAILTHRERRLPEPGASERAILAELHGCGIQLGAYHLPDWKETREGLRIALEGLFAVTPPTALIIGEVPLLFAVQQFLLSRGLKVPDDVSLVCTDWAPEFKWFSPALAHVRWEREAVVRRVMKWADNVSRGREDRQQTATKAEFIEGETIGPVPG